MGIFRIRVSYGPVGLGKTVKVRLYIPVPPYLIPTKHPLKVAQSNPIRVVACIEEMNEKQCINSSNNDADCTEFCAVWSVYLKIVKGGSAPGLVVPLKRYEANVSNAALTWTCK